MRLESKIYLGAMLALAWKAIGMATQTVTVVLSCVATAISDPEPNSVLAFFDENPKLYSVVDQVSAATVALTIPLAAIGIWLATTRIPALYRSFRFYEVCRLTLRWLGVLWPAAAIAVVILARLGAGTPVLAITALVYGLFWVSFLVLCFSYLGGIYRASGMVAARLSLLAVGLAAISPILILGILAVSGATPENISAQLREFFGPPINRRIAAYLLHLCLFIALVAVVLPLRNALRTIASGEARVAERSAS